jgi:hypothetical protein
MSKFDRLLEKYSQGVIENYKKDQTINELRDKIKYLEEAKLYLTNQVAELKGKK